MAQDKTIDVQVGDTFYTFTADDFPITDADGDDGLAVGSRIYVESLPVSGSNARGNLVTAPLGARVVLSTGDFATESRLRAGEFRYELSPGATNVVSGYATFTYSYSADEGATRSNTATITINLARMQTQMPATGAPTVTAPMGNTVWDEDALHTATARGIRDPNGFSVTEVTWQWQQAVVADGATPADSDYANIAADTATFLSTTFTPLQAHVGNYIRVCASFPDSIVPAVRERRCTAGNVIANVNDAPVAQNNTIFVPVGSSYAFSAGDFPFTDEDDDALDGVVLQTIPANGALSRGSTALTGSQVPRTVALDDIGAISYTATGQNPSAGYATFTFNVVDAGNDGVSNKNSTNTAAMTIDLVPSAPSAATGAPTVTAASGAAYNEGAELTAAIGDVADANGIPAHGQMTWQWQQSATTATDTYENIAGATGAAFVPGREHVGQYIRACLGFTDGIGAAEMRCSAGNIIVRVNSVSVPITADANAPYTFKLSDFIFPGDDIDNLVSITIVTTIASGKGIFRNDGAAVTANTTVTAAGLRNGDLTFYPPANTAAADSFASFTYTVNYGGANTATRTMNINLAERLRLRLRLFLEGPLR